jgi:heat shock protein HtpX
MEMCVDNPREDFADLFDTHPPVDARVAALVKFAGGHDPGPLALPPPADGPPQTEEQKSAPTATGPWSEGQESVQPSPWGPPATEAGQANKPFLPEHPPVDLGSPARPPSGPWGPRRDS